MTGPPVDLGDGFSQLFDRKPGITIVGGAAEACDVNIFALFASARPVFVGVGVGTKLATEKDAGLVIADAHHVIDVAGLSLLPFVDAPIESESVRTLGGGFTISLQLERTDGRIPPEQIGADWLHEERDPPNATVTIGILNAGLPGSLEAEARTGFSLGADDTGTTEVITTGQVKELQ